MFSSCLHEFFSMSSRVLPPRVQKQKGGAENFQDDPAGQQEQYMLWCGRVTISEVVIRPPVFTVMKNTFHLELLDPGCFLKLMSENPLCCGKAAVVQ